MPIDRTAFTLGPNPDFPVPLGPDCTVPTERMAYLLAGLLNTAGSVLEIGTGSGYQTAVLAERCQQVVSIESQPRHGVAEKLPDHVCLIYADGTTYDTKEQFDGVLITFAARMITPVWFAQVREGGRLVLPLSVGGSCKICVYEKHDGRLNMVEVACYAPFTRAVGAS